MRDDYKTTIKYARRHYDIKYAEKMGNCLKG